MRSLQRGTCRRIAACLGLLLVMLAGGLAAAAQDSLRPLLEALWLDIPARPTRAPDLALAGLGGETVRLTGLQGRIVMLYFWTTW